MTMTKTIALMWIAAAILSAETKPAPAPKPQPAKTQASRPAAPSIPEGAKQVEPYLYRYTDAQGKTWMYRQTPFGISKWEEGTVTQPVVPTKNPIGVTDLGDSYRFETKTPFG